MAGYTTKHIFISHFILFALVAFGFFFVGAERVRAVSCDLLVGTGTPSVELTFVIVPCSFSAAEATRFNTLADYAADAFSANIEDIPGGYVKDSIEPYASNQDKFSIWRANDFSGAGIAEGKCWNNPILHTAADTCGFANIQVISIANNSGEAGGNPSGNFSVVGSGTPSSCDIATCPQIPPTTCPPDAPPNNCSWDWAIKYTALHETGHTVYGFRHTDTDPSVFTGDSALAGPNCSGDPVCTEWQGSDFTSWVLPGDPPFGCFEECDQKDNWFRPWETIADTLINRDDSLINGFSPVERKIIADVLNGLPISSFNIKSVSGLIATVTDTSTAGIAPITMWEWDKNYNGVSFSSDFTFTNTVLPAGYPDVDLIFGGDGTYNVKLRVTNSAGSNEIAVRQIIIGAGALDTTQSTFTIDDQSAIVTVTPGTPYLVKGHLEETVSGSPIAGELMELEFFNAGKGMWELAFVNGVTDVAGDVNFLWTPTIASPSTSYRLKFSSGSGIYNPSSSPNAVSVTVGVAGNTGSITINGDAGTTSTSDVTLGFTCSGGCGVMRISNTATGLPSASSQPYSLSKSWTIPGPDGLKAVYVQFAKAGDPWWPIGGYADTIELSTVPGPGPGRGPGPDTEPVPCVPGDVCFGNPLGTSTFTELVDKVSNFIFLISLPIATLLFVISGFIFMTSAGNTKLISTSKQIIVWTIVGLSVSFLSKVLASILLGIL